MITKCWRTGKLPMQEFEAHNAMEDMRPGDPRQDLLQVFPCPRWASPLTAEHWHVGHRDPGGRIPRKGTVPRPPGKPLTHTLAAVLPAHLLALVDEPDGGTA